MIDHIPAEFSLSFELHLANPVPGDLLVLGESLHFLIREAGTDPALESWDSVDQNYLNFPLPDGRPLVLEVIARFDTQNPDRSMMRIGCPLSLLADQTAHTIILHVNSTHLQLVIDGQLMDEEWPVDPLLRLTGEPFLCPLISNLVLDSAAPAILESPMPAPGSLQYRSLPGHNAWAGDTMCIVHNGTFHLFYLYDRRHGKSRFGTGSHAIAHAVSDDLRTWRHLPMVVPINESWLTCGTGIPILRDDKIHLFFGLHTSRMIPTDQTTSPEMLETLKRTGFTQPVPFFQNGKFPEGTVIASSSAGETFKIDPIVIHPCQNPSPFVDPASGKVYLLAGYGDAGLYVSDDLQHWEKLDEKFTPCNQETPQENTTECQCHFEWNGWYYLLGGRTGFWMSRNFLGPFWSGAKNGLDAPIHSPRWDIYDGVWVPMIASWKDNRRILTAWMTGPNFEWGGHFVFRELIQHEDGTLGTKWVPEMIPPTEEPIRPPLSMRLEAPSGTTFADIGADVGDLPSSCRITMRLDAKPDAQSFGLQIGTCELKFSPALRRVQWATESCDTPAEDLPTLEEIMAIKPHVPLWCNPHPNIPFHGGDFTLQNVEGLHLPFTLDLIVLHDPKSNSTIIDACIDNRRTMITRRLGLKATSLKLFAHNGTIEVHDLTIRPIIGTGGERPVRLSLRPVAL